MPKYCSACKHRECRGAIRLVRSWLEVCGTCADRAKRLSPALHVLLDPSARAAYDAAIARGVTPSRAHSLALEVESMVSRAAVRQALDDGLLAAI